VVKLLIEKGGDPLLASNVSLEGRGEEESNLRVATRWNHEQIVRYFLFCNYEWSKKEIRLCIKEA